MLAALVEWWRLETHTFVMPVGEVIVTLENVLHIFGLPIDGEVVTGWTDSSHDLVNQSLAIFSIEPQVNSSSKSYINLSWVCHIRDTQRLDTWESVMRYVRWSHHPRTQKWMSMTQASIRHVIDFLEDFIWRLYVGIIIPAKLHSHLAVCDMVGPLVSFERVGWLPADRVVRQYRYAQSPLWQHKPYQLTRIAILFREYRTMTGVRFMTNGYNNGVTAATVVCEIRVCYQLSILPRLPIIGVGTSDHTRCTQGCQMSFLSIHPTAAATPAAIPASTSTASTTLCSVSAVSLSAPIAISARQLRSWTVEPSQLAS
ncbi:hypothetical protein AHAS_Ahas16G0218400 [Arachis hypogaea]